MEAMSSDVDSLDERNSCPCKQLVSPATDNDTAIGLIIAAIYS
jgi:hypothetical protein